MQDVTKILARFVAGSTPDSIPFSVRHAAKRSLLHWLGCSVGGSRADALNVALQALGPLSGPPVASVVGRCEKVDISLAAFLNGMSGDVLSFSDAHLQTVMHPGGLVGPAVLALAERQKVSGSDFLNAFLLGMEIACRVALTVYPWHYIRGWHISATVGGFGAAAGAGKLQKLSEEQMTWALGLAATQASGLRNLFGTMGKNFHNGRAAQAGLVAALLAGKNFSVSDDAIEGVRGFAAVFGENADLSKATVDLGSRFEVSENTFKPFPCGIVMSPAIDASLALHELLHGAVGGIRKVALTVHPLAIELSGNRTPTTKFEAKLSVVHAAAAALIHGRITEAEFSESVFKAPVVVGLRDSVELLADTSMNEDEAKIEVVLNDGGVLRHHTEHAIGSVDRPMSDRDIETKFHGLTEAFLSASQRSDLIDLCWNIEDAQDASLLARLTVPHSD